MADKKYEVIDNLSFQKSNEMISAKYKSSLLENQIMAIALARIEQNEDDSLKARLYPGELKRLVSDSTHIYRDLKVVSQRLSGHNMILEDGKGNFKTFALIPNVEYIDGVLEIKFNDVLKEQILELEKRGSFTRLELAVMTSFKSASSFRIYELLKKDIYKSNPAINDGRVDVEYNISELKFMIGLANIDDEGLRNEISRMNKNIDWDYCYDYLDKSQKKYAKFNDFKTRVIEAAKEELETNSDIRFTYEEGKKKGKKVLSLIFHIYPNTPDVEVLKRQDYIVDENGQLSMPRDLPAYKPLYDKYINHNNLTVEDIDLLLKKSDYNVQIIDEAIIAADEQDEINNYMGWIIEYIKHGGYKKTATLTGSAEKAEKVIAIMDEVNSKQEELQERAWERFKQKDNFGEFIIKIESLTGLQFDAFDLAYDCKQKTTIYTEFATNRPLSL